MSNARSMTTWLRLIALALVALVALACGGGGTATAPAQQQPAQQPAQQQPAQQAPAAKGPVEIRVAWWGSQDRHDRTIKAIELFMKKNPDIKVTYEFAVWDDYWTKMTTQAAGNSLPDVMQQDYAYIDEWFKRGLLAPLDDYVSSGAINLKDASEEFYKGGRVQGKLVAINLGSNSPSFGLDVDAFKKAGIAIPSDNWTWPEFEKIATDLHTKLGIWGFGHDLANDQMWKSIYFSAGEWAYTDDGKKIGYASDKILVDYLNMILRLQKAGVTPSRAEAQATYVGKPVEQLAIVTGKSAMDFFHSNQIIAVWKAAGENRNIKMVALPRQPGGKSANYIKPSQFFSVTSQSKQKEAAAKFIDFITNDVEANEILAAERGVPISSKVRDALKPKLGKAQVEMFDYVDRVAKDVQPIKPPDPAGHTDIVKNIWGPQVVDQVLFEKTTPEKAAALLRDEATKILAK
ncbi:MAG: sugar ABC transporter substrate-binding protein [Anaerolineae bacterium]|nr:sugar ABC transporter substrate-binding protein [Anaerolineae bacterium]